MKFLLTSELGRLAKWLRILGYDSAYIRENNHASLIIKALRESRIIISRNSHLGRSGGIKIALLKAENLKEQLKELGTKLPLATGQENMFSRCVVCNEQLAAMEKKHIKERVPEYVYQTHDDFFACPQCRRVYWQGTHWGNVSKILEELARED